MFANLWSTRLQQSPRRARRLRPQLEVLETRWAPATLVNGIVTYQDVDGDKVTVSISRPILNTGNVNQIFQFNTGTVNGDNSSEQQLQEINLTGIAAAAGASIKVTAVRGTLQGGDGFVNVGFIDAQGLDLGSVFVDGDLGRIDAGAGDGSTAALASLQVQSMGRFATSTLESDIVGQLGSLVVASDLDQTFLNVQWTNAANAAKGSIGSIFIGGSLLGGASASSGAISTSGNMGAVTIRGDVVGGPGDLSGSLNSGGSINSLTLGGSLVGGAGARSGVILSGANMGQVNVAGDVRGGSGHESGSIGSSGNIAGARVGGSLIGGTGAGAAFAAAIDLFDGAGAIVGAGSVGPVTVGGGVEGGAGDGSGDIIAATGTLASLNIGSGGGGLDGGDGNQSGFIYCAASMGPATIAAGVNGGTGAGAQAGEVLAGSLAGITLGGSLIGGTQTGNGSIQTSDGAMGPVKINGNVEGGGGNDSAAIESNGPMGAVLVNGNLVGGAGNFSGSISPNGPMGAVTINGNLVGGAGMSAGTILPNGSMGAVTVNGNVVGGAGYGSGLIEPNGNLEAATVIGSIVGGSGIVSGGINSNGNVGPVVIFGNVQGGSNTVSGYVRANGNTGPITIKGSLIGGNDPTGASLKGTGFIQGHTVASVTIGGSIIAGENDNADPSTDSLAQSGAIGAAQALGPVVVGGSLIGNGTNPVVISALGQVKPVAGHDLAIAGLTVHGRVEDAKILAGYDINLSPVSADAQIGPVTVALDWITSEVLAGAVETHLLFSLPGFAKISDPNDNPSIQSSLAAVSIGGQVIGGGSALRIAYAFAAEIVKSLNIGGVPIPLKPGSDNDSFLIGASGNVSLVEV